MHDALFFRSLFLCRSTKASQLHGNPLSAALPAKITGWESKLRAYMKGLLNSFVDKQSLSIVCKPLLRGYQQR